MLAWASSLGHLVANVITEWYTTIVIFPIIITTTNTTKIRIFVAIMTIVIITSIIITIEPYVPEPLNITLYYAAYVRPHPQQTAIACNANVYLYAFTETLFFSHTSCTCHTPCNYH